MKVDVQIAVNCAVKGNTLLDGYIVIQITQIMAYKITLVTNVWNHFAMIVKQLKTMAGWNIVKIVRRITALAVFQVEDVITAMSSIARGVI